MTGRNDLPDDRSGHAARDASDLELGGLAMAAVHQHERSITVDETEAALADVRRRIAAGDTGERVVTEIPARRPAQIRWLVAVAAVATAVLAGGILVATRGGDGTIAPGTAPTGTLPTVSARPVPTVPATRPAQETTLPPATVSSPPPATSATTTEVAGGEPAVTVDTIDDVRPDLALDVQPTALTNHCAAEFECTQVGHTEDGRIVTYDPVDDLLRVFDPTGVESKSEIVLTESLARTFPFLEHVGPDDVAYLTVTPTGAQDPIRDLIAVPLAGPTAGTVLSVASGLDGSGDSTLVAGTAGLALVPCCGPDQVRPSPDAPLYPWVDRDGNRIESDAPTFRVELGAEGNDLVRVEADATSTMYPLPALLQYPRDIPKIVATDEGGALAIDSVNLQTTATTVIVRFRPGWPDFGIDNGDVHLVDGFPPNEIVLEPSGTVLVANGDRFDRLTLDEIGPGGWPGRSDVEPSSGITTAAGLNEFIDAEQPSWAADPSLFGYQIAQSVGPNENVQVDVDDAGGTITTITTITIVTTGFLDDSVAAVRQVIRTERAPDGLLRFVDGTFENQCRPGRGHQDFAVGLCA